MAMASAPSLQEHRKSMAIGMGVPQLLTPEEPLAHSFATKASIRDYQAAVPSPPASPEFNPITTQSHYEQNDDVLYPENTGNDETDVDRPLFESSPRFVTPDPRHTPSTEDSLSVATPSTQHHSPPQKDNDELPVEQLTAPREEGSVAPIGPVALNNHFGLDWYRYCRIQNEEYQARKMAQRTLPPPTRGDGRDPYTRRVISSLGRASRIEKPTAHGHTSTKPRLSKGTAPKATATSPAVSAVSIKHESQTKRSRRQTSTPDALAFGAFSNAVQPKPRTRAAPSKKIDDKGASDWRQIPDYCPPLDSLDKMGDKLVVQWTNSNELNLSDDPDKVQLHPQELKIASTLRLKCNQYLANKRRIFQARVTALREGKDFNKTSAQTSTNIDVNKASRLWQAFDNVGWFNEEWFQQYL